MSLSLSHWYPGSGVVLFVSIPDLCTLTYFAAHTIKGRTVGGQSICQIVISVFKICVSRRKKDTFTKLIGATSKNIQG